MANNPRTPGVTIQEVSIFPPSIAAVETAIPAFIGYTEKARQKLNDDLRMKPKKIVSMLEFNQYFGGPQEETGIVVTIDETQDNDNNIIGIEVNADFATNAQRSNHVMFYCLQAYFANGGGPCYIVSTGPYSDIGTPIDPGSSAAGTGLFGGLDKIAKIDEVTLLVFPEIQGLSATDQPALYNTALQQCVDLQDRFTVMDIPGHTEDDDILTLAETFRGGIRSEISFLKYGAVYAPNLRTTLDYNFSDSDTTVVHNIINNNVTTPGPYNGNTMIELSSNNDNYQKRSILAINQIPVIIPAAPAVVGVYANVDSLRGVWKAPANVSLNLVERPLLQITTQEQNTLNIDSTAGKSINAIREFVGKGTLIWGARTLAGNDNEWRYISVRRFFNMVEESTKKATERFVFEPNDANTWIRVKSMIENFLTLQWRAGALQGATPEQAFFVNVGLGETMTALDILEGRMIVEIGMAVVRPAEFIILRFSHKLPEA